jgi:hypothetical protein
MRPVNRAPRLVSEGNFELKFVASIWLLVRPICVLCFDAGTIVLTSSMHISGSGILFIFG